MKKIKSLKINKKDIVVEDGREIYKKIEPKIKGKHKGQYVAIEPKSKDYFIGELPIDAINEAKKKYPRRMFYMTKIATPNLLPIK